MKMHRFVYPLLIYLASALLFNGAGCTINFTFDNGAVVDDKTSTLPAPKQPNGEDPVPSGDEPVLDEAQQERQKEVERYVMQVVYQGGQILHSFQLPSGDVVDFIARDTLPALPYALPPLPYTPEDLVLPPGVELGLSELEQIPELLALAATATPFHRPTFWPYILGETDATSIEDYLQRYQLGGQPFAAEHLYAGIASKAPNRGVSGFMNQFRPDVEPDSFSLIEFAVGCPANGPLEEMVGVVISVDKVNPFGPNHQALTDGEPRLHIEYARRNANTGQVEYQWDEADGQFRANPFRERYHPGQTVPVSVLGGTQVEHLISIFQAPVTNDWWIAYKEELLGYYPASLFTKLNGGACIAAWYGEVARKKPASATGWAKTEMGSGNFADQGLLNAAYVRNPKYYDTLWFGVEATGDFQMPSYVPSCYRWIKANWGAHVLFLLGGPGGKDSGCKVP